MLTVFLPTSALEDGNGSAGNAASSRLDTSSCSEAPVVALRERNPVQGETGGTQPDPYSGDNATGGSVRPLSAVFITERTTSQEETRGDGTLERRLKIF